MSGAAGLVYQVVWMRKLILIMGATSQAVSTVLVVFMGGLALGSWLLGKAGDKKRSPLLFYGWLELGIAAFGILSVILLDGLLVVYADIKKSGAVPVDLLPLIRFLLAVTALIGPTTLMGGSLPVLVRGICGTRDRIARTSGLLYAINTLGAVAGVLFATFYSIPALGLRNTVFVAAGLNIFVGLAAVLLARAEKPTEASVSAGGLESEREKAFPDSATIRAVICAFGVSGFLALSYEVLWTRYLIYVLGDNSVVAFTTMLAAFLVGIVLGSLLASWIGDHVDDLVIVFGAVQVLIGAAAFSTMIIMESLLAGRLLGWGPYFWLEAFGACLLVLIVPTTLSGSTFAFVAKMYARKWSHLGRDTGRAYAVNTLGGILGAAAGGFLVLPYLGLRYGLIALGSVNVAVGLWILLRSRPEGRATNTASLTALIAAVCLTLIIVQSDPAITALGTEYETVEFYEDGPEASVAVGRDQESGILRIVVNGDAQASTDEECQIHLRLLGHLPALFHPDPKQGLCIGFGTGISAGCLAQHPFKRIDVVELSKSVIKASKLFEKHNHDPLHDQKVNLILDDGRNYLLTSNKKYDVITSDPINPDDAGLTNLYSVEFYQIVREHLRAGGVACQWLPAGYGTEDNKILLRTFCSVFPCSSLWYAHGTTIVIGLKAGPKVTMADIRKRIECAAVKKSLDVIGLNGVEDLLPLCIARPDQLQSFVGDGPVITDDRPIYEYRAVRYRSGAEYDERSFWTSLLACRSTNMSQWIVDWSEKDEQSIKPPFGWMSNVLNRSLVQWFSPYEQEYEQYDNLNNAEKDALDLRYSGKQAMRDRILLDTTWEILGSPVSPLYGIMAELASVKVAAEGPYGEAMDKALEAWAKKDYDSAQRAFESASTTSPSDITVPLMTAACLDRKGDIRGALESLLGIQLQPYDPRAEVVCTLATCLLRQFITEMGKKGADKSAMGRFLLDITPDDAEKPEPEYQEKGLYARSNHRYSRPKPTEHNAEDVDSWLLWLWNAEWQLETSDGTFVWRQLPM